jgi:hypothetical protein
MVVKVGQVSWLTGVNEKYVDNILAFLAAQQTASTEITTLGAENETTDAYKTLLAANTTYATAITTAIDLVSAYYKDNGTTFASEAAARATLQTGVATFITAHNTFVDAVKLVINVATKNSKSVEDYYNFTPRDSRTFREMLRALHNASQDSSISWSSLGNNLKKRNTGTAIETLSQTTIPAVCTAMKSIAGNLAAVITELESAAYGLEFNGQLPLPDQANVAKAITALDAVKTQATAFSTANTAVETAMAADIA